MIGPNHVLFACNYISESYIKMKASSLRALISDKEHGFFLSATASRPALGPKQPLF
jgi:hypothetical protein